VNKTITLNDREVKYELVRKRVKNINLRIRSDGSVYVSANPSVAQSVIDSFLIKKSDYILLALDKYADIVKYAVADHSFVTGESFGYLGKALRLNVIKGNKNFVASDGIYLTLCIVNPNDTATKRKVIEKWYDTQCEAVFSEVMTATHPIFHKYGVSMPKLKLRTMNSRWGSCQPMRGVITLNKRLIETPRSCIEYVVMHEFIHFLIPNHSKAFYVMLSALMPDWKERKRILESTRYLPLNNGI
jgi:predicted metal-dependent hydrolase